ncbi:MAG: flagellar basal body P-ring formation chaperone FlgA [Gammaproteobacteria bacterium]
MLLKKREVLNLIFTTVVGVFCAANCFAANFSYESVENIKTVAKDFVLKNVPLNPSETIEVQVDSPQPPLRVGACSKTLDASFPADANRDQVTSVELSCNGVQTWHVYVPVNVRINTNVLVAKRTIPLNDVITEDDMDFAQYDRNRLYNGYFSAKENVIGQVASQLIASGTVLTKKNVQQPVLVHRNQTVDLIARTNSITVTMKGVAKSDGSLNEVIKAYNPSSKRILDAVVVGSNKVEVV